MSDPNVERLQRWINDHEDEMVAFLVELLRIPSVQSDPQPKAPFGAENRQALDLVLAKARQWNMNTTDMEGYCGFAEFGEGKPMVMSMGHLDVVPVGPGWKFAPFGATIDSGYLYARGSTDDKGPTVASFFAMRAIQSEIPDLGVRMRQWFGCNEESGFECIHHYTKTGEAPTFGVAPDSGWPLYHGEKGIAQVVVGGALIEGAMSLEHIEGGQRPNIVIDRCDARVRVSTDVRAEVQEKLDKHWDRNVEWNWADGKLHVVALGKAAHGAWPIGGDNAATRLLRFLYDIAPPSVADRYSELMEMTHMGGGGIGIAGADEPSGDLTANLGIVRTVDGHIEMTFNPRYPVTWTGEQLRAMCEKHLHEKREGRYSVVRFSDSPPLYFPLDHPLVRTICEVYEAETGDKKAPGTMGGGTYARAIASTVSIGTCWEGDGHAHETDERIKVAHVARMARIYAHILYRLALEARSQTG